MATTDKDIAPQQTDIFKFVIVRPPELITTENQNKHYVSPTTGILNKEILKDFSDSFIILSKPKKIIFELYRQLNKDKLLHEKIKNISESLESEINKLKTLFDTKRTEKKEEKDREIEALSSESQNSFQVHNDSQQKIYFLKTDLENLAKTTFMDFLFLNLAYNYRRNFSQSRKDNLELDLALIQCLNYTVLYKTVTVDVVDFKKIDPQIIKDLHESLNISPVLGNLYGPNSIFHVEIPNINTAVRNIGSADLKVVKQKLIRYQTGEIAHIENVLRGESKERKHRQLDRTENIFTTSTETIEETTRDTQTTDRFELQKEVQKAVQEKMDIAAGITVKGKGIVEYSAHADFAYSTAKQDSEKTASTLAKEIIDKSVSRIQKTVREERTTKTIHEVEELNTHTLDNKGKDTNISGIYCWVDKVYLAELYNYGHHLMLEVAIPEPATFYRQLFDKKKEAPESLSKSKPDDLPVGFSHGFINEHNYKELAIQYQAETISTPPIDIKNVSANLIFTQEGHVATAQISTEKIIIPEGYRLTSGYLNFSVNCWNIANCHILIGDKVYDTQLREEPNLVSNAQRIVTKSGTYQLDERSFGSYQMFPQYSGTQIPFSVVSYDCFSYSVTFTGRCDVLDSTKAQWQISTYEKIIAGYNKLLQIYEDSLNAHDVQVGIQIQGQNPLINREIEKTELKRQCIEALLENAIEHKYAEFGSTEKANPPATPITPRVDFTKLVSQNKTIQFFEQAIDWENMTYLFFPYFWGKEERWETLANTQDIDPIFTKFLQAGSARVSLPVTQNYDDAITHYLATGSIWNTGALPALDDPMYLSVADEIRRQTDENYKKPKKEDNWEVVIPTTLVYLREDGVLPNYTK